MWIAILILLWLALMGTVWHFVKRHRAAQRREGRKIFLRGVKAYLSRGELSPELIAELAGHTMLDSSDQRSILEELYSAVVRSVYQDRKVTESERAHLKKLAACMGIADGASKRLETRIKERIYKDQVKDSLSDGAISESEARQLRAIRRRFGIEQVTTSKREIPGIVRSHLRKLLRQSLESGTLTNLEMGRFEKIASDLGVAPQLAASAFSEYGADAYRRFASFALEDDNISDSEQAQLDMLQAYFKFPDSTVSAANSLLAETREVMEIRAGNLPEVAAPMGLGTGEDHHVFERSHCISWNKLHSDRNYSWATGHFCVSGSKVEFRASKHGWRMPADKVQDAEVYRQNVVVTFDGKASQVLTVNRPRIVAEILEAVCRPTEEERSRRSTRSRSRYIEADVRHEVWERDGGQCMECGSFEYLEFDHIVPYSKGGSNGVRNLQLLCRPCNRSKSDII